MKRILREPLVHFLLLGAALFLVHGWLSRSARGDGGESGAIVITQGQIDHLVAGYTQAWRRPPSPEDLAGLVRDRVREEVYCREAIALGLDKDDTVIRRRLRQKLEFISDDIAARAEPTDADLNAYLHAHPEAFRVRPRFTFRHVYLSPDRRGEHLARDSAQLLAQLNQPGGDTDVLALGDAFLLERGFAAIADDEVAKLFGDPFAAALGELRPGQWHGPIKSGFGAHLVVIDERKEGRLPALADVRAEVRREWANARRLEANERFFQELLKRYTVTIAPTETSEADKKLAQRETE